VTGEILILGYVSPEAAETVYNYGLTLTLVDEAHARELSLATERRLRVQYAIDTGMRRLGLDGSRPSACERAIRAASERFELNGIFTHLSAADSTAAEGRSFTLRQAELFASVARRVSDLHLPFVHCLNTAGGLSLGKLPEGIGKFVRLGISLYGLSPSFDTVLPAGIQPALSWYATVASVRAVKKGETVGYGFGYVAERDGIIATLTVGYADGYSRAASGRACVLIGGHRAPVVGKVCMDQTMVDVSRLPHVRAGDRAVLIGSEGKEKITADELGEMLGTIGYEIVCGISGRVERIYK
jgi:alanine racemase